MDLVPSFVYYCFLYVSFYKSYPDFLQEIIFASAQKSAILKVQIVDPASLQGTLPCYSEFHRLLGNRVGWGVSAQDFATHLDTVLGKIVRKFNEGPMPGGSGSGPGVTVPGGNTQGQSISALLADLELSRRQLRDQKTTIDELRLEKETMEKANNSLGRAASFWQDKAQELEKATGPSSQGSASHALEEERKKRAAAEAELVVHKAWFDHERIIRGESVAKYRDQIRLLESQLASARDFQNWYLTERRQNTSLQRELLECNPPSTAVTSSSTRGRGRGRAIRGGHGHSQQNAIALRASEIESREQATLAMENLTRSRDEANKSLQGLRQQLLATEGLLDEVLGPKSLYTSRPGQDPGSSSRAS